MSYRIAWILKTILLAGIIVILNYPIAYAICHDITPHFTTLISTILVLSLLYGFYTLLGPHHFYAAIIGILTGNLISFFTWIISFRASLFHLSTPETLSAFYSLGIFVPTVIYFFHDIKKNRRATFLHSVFMFTVSLALLAYLLFKLIYREIHPTFTFNFLHFGLGFIVGLMTTTIIHYVLSRNLLVFEKITPYMKVMLKPILAFFLGYLLIMFTFTGLYTLAYFSNPSVFNHLSDDTFGELMFYSFSTITGVGFSIIDPEKPITLFLTTAENFLGLVWMTVVFAAALAYLQAPFRHISEQLEKLIGDEKTESLK